MQSYHLTIQLAFQHLVDDVKRIVSKHVHPYQPDIFSHQLDYPIPELLKPIDLALKIRMKLAKVWWCEVCPFRACAKHAWALNLWL